MKIWNFVFLLAVAFQGPNVWASCPVLVGKYKCPGILTVGPFQLEIKQSALQGQMRYEALLSAGQDGTHITLANSAGVKNEDGHVSTCVNEKLSVRTVNPTLGEVTGEISKGPKNSILVTLIGVTPEPWQALVCEAI